MFGQELSLEFWTGLTVAVLFLIIGLLLQHYPPKRINHWIGYRTSLSKSSQQHWDFAQKYSGTLFWKGAIFIALWVLIFEFVFTSVTFGPLIDLLPMILVLFYIIRKTEKALKKINH